MPIADLAAGRFSFLALYPFDTRVILKVPPRWTARKPGLLDYTPDRLCDRLNRAGIRISPVSGQSEFSVTFSVVPLTDIFIDSPNATWSALRAPLPAEWFRASLNTGSLGEADLDGITSNLLLFDGGITVLSLELSFRCRGDALPSDSLPEVIRRTADGTVRYNNEALTTHCRTVLNAFATALQEVVTVRSGPEEHVIREEYGALVDRIRPISVPEAYPTIVTKIECRRRSRPATYDLRTSDLTRAMYLDASELSNALPTFEDDFVAVGYDPVWWLQAAEPQERTASFRARVDLTFEYALATSMLIYVLHTEIDQELRELRLRRARTRDITKLHEPVDRVTTLRREVEDLLKELSLESFSTWVSDIHLFKTILENWLVQASASALRAKIDTVNVFLRELYQEAAEREQREMTRIGAIFAAASLSTLIVASMTLVFTQSRWEQQDSTTAALLLIVKIMLIAYLLTLPWFVLNLTPRWDHRIRSVIQRFLPRER